MEGATDATVDSASEDISTSFLALEFDRTTKKKRAPTQASTQPSSWLLRLFESDFFDARLALSYLHRHSESVGIHHYICDALRKFPENDIEFLLPQLCHMAITRPSQSVALEAFLADLCRSSQHMAVITLWILDAYLKDMQLHNVQNASFRHCQRMYHTCQTIIFDDTPVSPVATTSTESNAGLDSAVFSKTVELSLDSSNEITAQASNDICQADDSPTQMEFPTISTNQDTEDKFAATTTAPSTRLIPAWPSFGRIYSHIPPSIVGMGVILAGFGNPTVFKASSRMILTQARYPRTIDVIEDPDADILENDNSSTVSFEDEDSTKASLGHKSPQHYNILPAFLNLKLLTRIPTSSPSLDELSKGSAFSFTNFVRKTTGLVAASISGSSIHCPPEFAETANLNDQIRNIQGSTTSPIYASSAPTNTFANRRVSTMSTDSNTTALALRDQSHLISSHYFHSEIQFIMTLVDISDRLRAVPKSARQSMLVAELTLLNHNLPADVCIPFWCPSDSQHPMHHRVVRVSPADAVVLNSADRVPYLMMIEVVSTNHRIMTRKAVRQLADENGGHSSRRVSSLSDLHGDQIDNTDQLSLSNASSAEYYREVLDRRQSFSKAIKQPTVLKPLTSANSRSADITAQSSHYINSASTMSANSLFNSPGSQSGTSRMTHLSYNPPVQSARGTGRQMSMSAIGGDEFSERMRTAAVMLAQLYQQQQKDSTVHPPSRSNTASNGSYSTVSGTGDVYSPRQRHISEQGTLANVTTTHGHVRGQSPNRGGQLFRSISSGGVPQSTDRRTHNTMRNDFEAIRGRVIKEMMALEQQRMEALALQFEQEYPTSDVQSSHDFNNGDTKHNEAASPSAIVSAAASTSSLGKRYSVVSGVEEILPAKQEQRLRTDSLKKDLDDPSASVFREPWRIKKERIRLASPFGRHPNWDLISVIVKSGADLRQEKLALQLISEMQHIWSENHVSVWVYSFRMLITSEQSGLVETIRDAISIHSIKKEGYARNLNQQGIAFTLYDYFIKEFGHPGCDNFQRAQDNFMRSLAGYSIICYLLQIKDRHNGNILLDLEGHCTHIDFGFMLTNSPGSVGFELAPFKLPQEYLDILGGIRSRKFGEFRALVKEAFLALRKSADSILCLVEIMEKDSLLPCFTGVTPKPSSMPATSALSSVSMSNGISMSSTPGVSGIPTSILSHSPSASPAGVPPARTLNDGAHLPNTKYPVSEALRDRFQLVMTEAQVGEFVDRLIDSSCNNMFTKLYDSFQYYANGIL
ncbi:hypothetical protein BDV3_000949 [Batrachochytrium dendrobatidis]|nr:Phosphatidylinositol 4-kinase pik1alpha (PI4-kinase)(PtdIns-4-kinase) [Batrachochytrium dendrobatidis]KAK5672186.1 Phosphatidylinositol 4-kinase pik1alpha (PI4-kinase)(PtdIns-4-kinase) [Batrachochytrium dendrobatidis]